jgi:DNA-directed RNA polymerase alpha subunit
MRIERFTIEEADLTVRSYRCLKRYGIAYNCDVREGLN